MMRKLKNGRFLSGKMFTADLRRGEDYEKAKRDQRAEDKYVYNQGHKVGKEEGIEIGKEQGIEIGKSQSLTIFVNYMRKNVLLDAQIVEELMPEYGLSYEDALESVY